ncbi:DNA-binding LacI/PurR family transcriptional regulator [Scopulibacillus darangshiensis]|uniref:DNA-binding LacI/PurR family transcriptional regulator n=1 Tax=Scopulibacillus darangshiensis TaxID=442528 RepID=A0A4R2PAB3_9BACL|nr:GntR family transcriptional regulator [Scopulibacillus darangshiensis]TCP30835.1 DNA-binding LacI/PurR family transcriptional regulator [Scopulibacillus darangshiensis]
MKALYLQVYQSLKKDIIDGKYTAGDRVPSEKELSDFFRVSRITSKKALGKLVEDGIVYRQRGKGTFVADNWGAKDEESVGKKPVFGLIVTNFDDSYGSKLLSSIENASDEKCFIILKRSLGSPDREEKIIKELLDLGVDGLIIYPAQAEHFSSEILKMVVNRFPLVLIDRYFKGVAAASVSTDNAGAAKKGIEFLFDLGHEQIGVLSPRAMETTTIEERFGGIVQAYAERNVIANRELWCTEIKSTLPSPKATIEEDIETIIRHLKKKPKITALFTLEYNIALLAKRAVKQLGLRVPEDMSILCFDGPENDMMGWNFTRLQQDEDTMGRVAITRLLDMNDGKFSIKKERFSAALIEGDSTLRLIRNN